MAFFKEEIADFLWQLMLENVAYEAFADVSSAAFIANNES